MSASSLASPRRSQSASHRAYRRIRDLIIAGRLSPGARLVEAELAGSLGVSRGAVRPALLRLRQEGFATVQRPGKQDRLVVAPLTRADSIDLFSILGELEGLAAAQACRCESTTHGQLITELRRVMESLEGTGGSNGPDAKGFLAGDRAFHRVILEAGAGKERPRLLALHASLRPQLDRYSLLYAGHIQGHLPAIMQEHRAILAALERRDAEGTQRAIRANWQRGSDRLVETIDRLGGRGDWTQAAPVNS